MDLGGSGGSLQFLVIFCCFGGFWVFLVVLGGSWRFLVALGDSLLFW